MAKMVRNKKCKKHLNRNFATFFLPTNILQTQILQEKTCEKRFFLNYNFSETLFFIQILKILITVQFYVLYVKALETT